MKKSINVDKLIVNYENYRFDPVDTQSEAIDLMLEEKGEEILNLAKHIFQHGLDRAKDCRVIEIKKDLFLVLDGNRRVTAIKCLKDSSLIKNDSLKNKFSKISKEKGEVPKEIDCLIYEKEEAAAEWIKLDHTGKNKGIGQDEWGAAEKQRFDYKFGGRISPAMQSCYLFERETKQKLDTKRLKISTVNRILSNPEARSYLGLDIRNGDIILTANKKEVIDRLDKLFNKIIIDDIPVSQVYRTPEAIRFMSNLFGEKPKASTQTTVSPTGIIKKIQNTSKRSLPRSKNRNTLIPYDCTLQIHEAKINNIYYELKNIPLDEYTNAAAVLFRVFLETSIDYYAHKHGMTFDSKIKLSGKITKVTDDLEAKKLATKTQLKNIRNVATKRNSILSIDNFHEYVHSFKNQPIAVDLIYTWDNLREFFEILWEENARKNRGIKK
jgi:hypothetical protein